MVDKSVLLSYLPPFKNEETVIVPGMQSVPEIMNDLIDAHYFYQSDYDCIYEFFITDSVFNTCRLLWNFCKENVLYKAEPKRKQTSRSPAAILVLGDYSSGSNDCKHNAAFCGGILDAINRNCDWGINWNYRFASYDMLDDTPAHVFVVVKDNGEEIWLDPVLPKFDQRLRPYTFYDEKIKRKKMIARISGIEDEMIQYTDLKSAIENNPIVAPDPGMSVLATPEFASAISVLMYYNVMNLLGEVDMETYRNLESGLPADQVTQLQTAFNYVSNAAQQYANTIGSFFGDIFQAVQHVTAGMGMQVPRAAFLGLVKVNAFGYANKLARAEEFTDSREKLEDIWWRLGGDEKALRAAIDHGKTLPAAIETEQSQAYAPTPVGTYRDNTGVLHYTNDGSQVSGAIGELAVAAGVIASAAVIVAAIMPVISKLLDKHNANVSPIPIDPATGYPVGYSTNANSFTAILQQYWPLFAGAAAIGLYLVFSDNKKRA